MIIHPPEISQTENEVCLSAKVTYDHHPGDIPEYLWFCYPKSYAPYISDRADAFAAGLVLISMHLKEAMRVEGALSPKLLYGLREYQRVFHAWHPKLFTPEEITCIRLAPMPNQGQSSTGLTFSGGIDSFYTLWRNLPKNQPLADYRITHCLFLHGYDISLLHEDDFQAAYGSFKSLFQSLGIELLTCRSNLHAFSERRVSWHYAHGPALLAPVLGIGLLFNKFYIASSLNYRDLAPTGVTPVTDHLFSTETLQVIHHGAETIKPYKLEAIASWKPAWQNLRICVDQQRRLGVQNCGECFKCLRARVNLKMVGASGFQTLPEGAPLRVMIRWALLSNTVGIWAQDMIGYAKEKHKWQYLPLYWFASIVSLVKHLIRKMMPHWFFLWLRNRLYPPQKNPFLHSTIQTRMGKSPK